jgi:Nucleotide-diphospho-sugar transferase
MDVCWLCSTDHKAKLVNERNMWLNTRRSFWAVVVAITVSVWRVIIPSNIISYNPHGGDGGSSNSPILGLPDFMSYLGGWNTNDVHHQDEAFKDPNSFCYLLRNAISDGPREGRLVMNNVTSTDNNRGQQQQSTNDHPRRRKMVHAFVSNSGHIAFLQNVLLSMKENNIPWTPVVFAMDEGVCESLAASNDRMNRIPNSFHDQQQHHQQQQQQQVAVCILYLDRHLQQLARDEPESIEQIEDEMKKRTTPWPIQKSKRKETVTYSRTTTTNYTNNTRYETMIGKNFFGWGSVEHKFLINVKMYVLRDILNCNVDAFVTDTDMAFRDDPRPYFEIDGPKGDVVAQNDTNDYYKLSLNSGLMYWRNTPTNRKLADDMITTLPFWWNDQSRVNWLLHNRSTPHTLLNADEFPNGHMMNNYWDKIQDKVVIAHANWNSKYSEKQERLAKAGLWFLDNNTTTTTNS